MSSHRLTILFLAATFAFAAEPKAAAPDRTTGSAAAGKTAYQQCAFCHDNGAAGPKLNGMFKRKRMADKKTPMTEANVRMRIVEGGEGMPGFRSLKPKDLDDLLAYLKTL